MFTTRRNILLALAGAPIATRGQTTLAPTPADMEGPFYPLTLPPQAGSDLTRVPGTQAPAEGERLRVSGRVLGTRGQPVPGAVVEIWQADARGSYIHPRGASAKGRDPGFMGYGRVATAADGAYAFTTIVPPAYESRPPHIHFKVTPPSGAPLITQLYFDGRNAEGGFMSSLRGDRQGQRARQTVATQKLPQGGRAAVFDVVLGG